MYWACRSPSSCVRCGCTMAGGGGGGGGGGWAQEVRRRSGIVAKPLAAWPDRAGELDRPGEKPLAAGGAQRGAKGGQMKPVCTVIGGERDLPPHSLSGAQTPSHPGICLCIPASCLQAQIRRSQSLYIAILHLQTRQATARRRSRWAPTRRARSGTRRSALMTKRRSERRPRQQMRSPSSERAAAHGHRSPALRLSPPLRRQYLWDAFVCMDVHAVRGACTARRRRRRRRPPPPPPPPAAAAAASCLDAGSLPLSTAPAGPPPAAAPTRCPLLWLPRASRTRRQGAHVRCCCLARACD